MDNRTPNTITKSRLSNAAISEYAELIGQRYGAHDVSGRVNLDALVATLGGQVVELRSIVAREALTVERVGDFVIYLPPLESELRRRLTIARELGHYLVHYVYPKVEGRKVFERGGKGAIEVQANVFAASLLMPSHPFRTAFAAYGNNWWRYATVFGVSPKASRVRAQVLGLDQVRHSKGSRST